MTDVDFTDSNRKRRIAIVTMGVKLGDERKGYDRFKSLANILVDTGHDVDLITTTFQHWEKAQRDLSNPSYQEERFNVVFFPEPGYKKNVDLARIHSHAVAAKNLFNWLHRHADYDLIYSEIPPNDVALACATFCHTEGIPYVVDVNDLWPEAMRMVLDVPVVNTVLFSPMAHDAAKVYELCSAAVGTSDEYASWPEKIIGRPVEHITVYVGNRLDAFDEGARTYAAQVDKPQGEYWVTYAGTIGTSYDIKTMVLASELLKKQGHDDIRFMILGGGPTKDELEQLARSLDCNVTFVGYAAYPLMAAYLTQSDVVVNSFVRKAPQSIVTKIGDYLASAKPMINTGMSPEFRGKVDHDGFGVNIEPEDPQILADAILKLHDDPALSAQMGAQARAIAEEQFDRSESYQRIVALIDRLIAENEAKRAQERG